ncbi:uncharacterized protein [Solanum lycopersicum]|uniref:uncharacterized protein n=1 Tax=Solanum lycopersicum TaxID=4081 RepID=UPI00374832FA
MKSVPKHCIDDESLKEYFYRGQDDNSKSMLDTIVGGSYRECTYAEITENLENIFRNNKALSTLKSDTGRNTFVGVKTCQRGVEKVNVVSYLDKPPPLVDEYYYEEDSYAVNEQMGVSVRTSKAPISKIGAKVKEIKVASTGITTERVTKFEMATTTARKTLTREVSPRDGGSSMARVEDMLQKMMRRFDDSDEHDKELRGDLVNIGQKVDVHAISIKHLELQMSQLSSTVNPRQTGTLPSNTVQNPKNDWHCMKVTTRGGKKTMDPPMSFGVEHEKRGDDEVEEYSGDFVDKSWKEAETPQKVTPIPRQPAPFLQRLVKKAKNCKYQCFITMLKHLSINVPMIEAREQIPSYAKFMKNMVTKNRSDSFEDDDRMQHCSAIATTFLVQKKEDPGAFTIPCTIVFLHSAKALCDLGSSINLMPLSIYKKLSLFEPKPTAMRLPMVNQTVDIEVPIILGRSFLATGHALVEIEKGEMKFRLNNEEATFNTCRSMRQNVVFAFENIFSYFSGTGVIVHTDHSAFRYLMEKKDAKPRLIRWVLLLQEFDFEVKDRKGTENQVVDHLSQLDDGAMPQLGEKTEIDDTFPTEHVLVASQDLIPWFADFANYLASDIVPSDLFFYQRKKFMHDVKNFFWDDPYLYMSCANGRIQRCVPEVEMLSVLETCQS